MTLLISHPLPTRDDLVAPVTPVVAPTTQRVVTVHAGGSMTLRLALLDAIERTLQEHGAERVWIDPAGGQDLVVLAEVDGA